MQQGVAHGDAAAAVRNALEPQQPWLLGWRELPLEGFSGAPQRPLRRQAWNAARGMLRTRRIVRQRMVKQRQAAATVLARCHQRWCRQ
jgi:hypothetical protein